MTESEPSTTPAADPTPSYDTLKKENEALRAECARLRKLAFSLEVTAKTLASMTPMPVLVE
jgi:hypothetical protein